MERPSWDEYFMNIARQAARRSNCIRRQVGAIVVKERAIISTGYNGTPMGVRNCCDGGCLRCRSKAEPGEGYDTCVCVHAEENAIVLAARHGTATEASALYSTLRPCFGCVKSAIQAGIREIVYGDEFTYPPDLETVYSSLVSEAGLRVRHYTGP